MKTIIKLFFFLILLALLIGSSYYWFKNYVQGPNKQKDLPLVVVTEEAAKTEKPLSKTKETDLKTPEIVFVGPRENIPEDAPTAHGFWSFSYPIPGVLSRSGQPTIQEFKWLREHGWKGIVDMRDTIDHGEPGDDRKIPGFTDLGFNYLHLPTPDGHPPTDEDAQKFLEFIQNPANQPVHVHCRGGIGRGGTMVVLTRVKLQNWPLEKAVEESRLYQGGISSAQLHWLERYLNEQ